MNSSFRFAFAVVLAAWLHSPRATGLASSVESVAKANNAFCVDLYRELASESGNVIVSPFSIHTAFAMSYAGARGKTAREMASVLRFSKAERDVHASYHALLKGTMERSASGCEIVVANSLFAQTGYPFLKPFQELVRDNYDSGLNEIDLTGWPGRFDLAKAAAARKQINRWVADKTRDKITEILPSSLPDPDTRLILVNAVWFKGKWASQFPKAATKDAPFYPDGGNPVMVPMMNVTATFGYTERDGVQVLRMPYVSEHFSMIVCLPKKRGGLPVVEKALSPGRIEQWTRHCRDQEVAVFLPRFRLASAFDLESPLDKLGMKQAFTLDADFSGITAGKRLFIAAALHKACVDVDEEGTEAAASTVVAFDEIGVTQRPVFNANHPFLLLIRDNQTGLILFIGRVADPSKG
jgi:serine protease inhibitor